MISIHNDIKCALNEGSRVQFILLDQSSVFDAVDHSIFHEQLEEMGATCEVLSSG